MIPEMTILLDEAKQQTGLGDFGDEWFFENLQALIPALNSQARRVHWCRLSPEAEIVAWLHDIVEDTIVQLNEVEKRFDRFIRDAVDAMTKRDGEDFHEEYLQRVLSNPIAIPVKIADMSHNYGKLHLLQKMDPIKALKLTGKYKTGFDLLGCSTAYITSIALIVFDGQQWVKKRP